MESEAKARRGLRGHSLSRSPLDRSVAALGYLIKLHIGHALGNLGR